MHMLMHTQYICSCSCILVRMPMLIHPRTDIRYECRGIGTRDVHESLAQCTRRVSGRRGLPWNECCLRPTAGTRLVLLSSCCFYVSANAHACACARAYASIFWGMRVALSAALAGALLFRARFQQWCAVAQAAGRKRARARTQMCDCHSHVYL